MGEKGDAEKLVSFSRSQWPMVRTVNGHRTTNTTGNYAQKILSESAANTTLNRKLCGIYYTPAAVSRGLCKWAIRSPHDDILEPSFGGCGFLEASKERLLALNNRRPTQRLFGCDIDKNAFNHLYAKIGPSDLNGRFFLSDFLCIEPADFLVTQFDVIVGNPPYIAHHNMAPEQKTRSISLMKSEGVSLSGRASLWAYFVLHSLQFLKEGGRMAWVLPVSFLHADYATSVKNILKEGFRRLLVISSRNRLFLLEGTDEDTIILLAEGWREGSAQKGLEIYFADDLLCDVEKLVDAWSARKLNTSTVEDRSGHYLLSSNAMSIYEELINNVQTMKLADIAEIFIGMVTGDNNFFIINKQISGELKLSDTASRFILTKFNIVRGLQLDQRDIEEAIDSDMRCLLVDTNKMRRKGPLSRYIESYPEEKRKNNKTFQKRTTWYKPDDGRIPDAFFPYMHHAGPRIVFNNAAVNCTNNIHRLYFKSTISNIQRKLFCISMLSSFSQLSAELAGRTYGSGVLKHEPSEAKKIAFVMPLKYRTDEVEEVFKRIDNYLRHGLHSKARLAANKFVMTEVPGKYGKNVMEVFEQELSIMRARRYGGIRKTEKA